MKLHLNQHVLFPPSYYLILLKANIPAGFNLLHFSGLEPYRFLPVAAHFLNAFSESDNRLYLEKFLLNGKQS